MRITVAPNAVELGSAAAREAARALRAAIAKDGEARIILSTGASQFETLAALVHEDVDWSRVTMFHLDEYVGMPATHGASFRKYLTERFTSLIPLGKAHFVSGDPADIPALTKELRSAPIHLGMIGIGENGHIAFNDPPADFNTREAYIIVNLNDTCKRQQVREGWFASIDETPTLAQTMTVYQIMQCEKIISCVPRAVKAWAVSHALADEESPMLPATVLRNHPDYHLFADTESFSQVDRAALKYEVQYL